MTWTERAKHARLLRERLFRTGKPFVRTWLHCAHLQMGGLKMAKSTGNIARVAEGQPVGTLITSGSGRVRS